MSTTISLSFYDHHRQSYGAMPLKGGIDAEFHVGEYGGPPYDEGACEGGEFSIELVRLGGGTFPYRGEYMAPVIRAFHDATGSLRAFLDSGAWDLVCVAAAAEEIRSRDDMTALLIEGGLHDRSHNPVGHVPVCSCCGRATETVQP